MEQDAVHVRGIALQMHGHDRLGLRGNPMFDVVRIEIERLVDLGEDRQRAGEHDGVVAGVPGPGRQDDFVAGPDFKGVQRRSGARRYRT